MIKLKFVNNTSFDGLYLEDDRIIYEGTVVSVSDNIQRFIRCGEFLNFLKNQSYLTGGIKYINTIDTPIEGESIYDKSFYYRYPKDITSEIPRIDVVRDPGRESVIYYLEEVEGPPIIDVSPPLRDIKVCDSWDPGKIKEFEETLKEIYDSRIGLDKPGEEILDNISSRYSQDYFSSNCSEVYELITFPTREYTNQIDIRQYIEKSSLPGISGKLDVTVEYRMVDELHIDYFSFTAFSYSEVLSNEVKIFKSSDVQGEYIGGIFTVYPISPGVEECIISDCVLSYGKL